MGMLSLQSCASGVDDYVKVWLTLSHKWNAALWRSSSKRSARTNNHITHFSLFNGRNPLAAGRLRRLPTIPRGASLRRRSGLRRRPLRRRWLLVHQERVWQHSRRRPAPRRRRRSSLQREPPTSLRLQVHFLSLSLSHNHSCTFLFVDCIFRCLGFFMLWHCWLVIMHSVKVKLIV